MNWLREKIGIMIREKRNSQRLTQEGLAEKVNLSTGMIGQIERGETMPSIESLDAIIKELGMHQEQIPPPHDLRSQLFARQGLFEP